MSGNTKLKPKQFLGVVRRSGILSETQLEFWLQRIHRSDPRIQKSAILLSQDLLDQKLVTAWQAKKLLSGKYKGFFVGKYKILRHIGSGGMSSVFLAEQSLTGQKRAIKVLPREKLKEKSYLARFYREAQAVASLNHPNIVRVYDVAEDQGIHHMVLEFVRGSDLHSVVSNSGPLDFDLAERCIEQSAHGLAAAHKQQIIHRDIKPANLLLTEDNNIKILDLGLALLKSEDRKNDISAQHHETMMGTVDYLAPEQAVNSHNIDHRADIYSLGCTLYFLLTCKAPFNKGTLAQRIHAHQTQTPEPIRRYRKDCPPHLEQICSKMLAKEPDDRFSGSKEIIEAIKSKQVVSVTSHPKPSATTQSHQPTPTSTKAPRKARRATTAWIAVGFLTLLISLLAILIFQRSQNHTASSFAAATENPTPSTTTITKPETNISQNTDQPNVDQPNVDQPNADLPKPTLSSLKPKHDGGYLADFNDRDSYQRTRSGINLIANQEQFGQLSEVSKSDFQSTQVSGETNHCIWIESGSKIPFRPTERERFLKSVALELKPENAGDDLKIEVHAKESISGYDKWQLIEDISSKLQQNEFKRIVLSDHLFNKMNLRKFRIEISGGKPNAGIFLKSLSVRFK